jgi:hypothetical protein
MEMVVEESCAYFAAEERTQSAETAERVLLI